MTVQEDRFAAEEVDAPKAILRLSDQGQPGWSGSAGVAGTVVLGEDAPNDVLVDLNAKGERDLQGDAHAAKPRVALLELDDGGDEFRGWTFGAGFAARRRRGGEEPAVLPFHQGLVELEQCRRPDQRAKLREPVRTHEQRGQAENDAIDGSEIGRPLPGAITDEQLVFE